MSAGDALAPGLPARGQVWAHPAMFIVKLPKYTPGLDSSLALAETISFGPAYALTARVAGDGQAARGKHSAGLKLPISW